MKDISGVFFKQYNQIIKEARADSKLVYLIYDKITLKVYKQIFHPQCINL